MSKIHFKTKEAEALWDYEILGQLSDGLWENSRPYGHWKFWAECKPVVDGKVGWESDKFPQKINYDLRKLLTIRIVTERMVAIINAAKNNKDPRFADELINESLLEALKNPDSDYWVRQANAIKKEYNEDLDEARQYVLKPYSKNDLRKFLDEIMSAINTPLNRVTSRFRLVKLK